jgi:hypothetical protein
VRATLLMTLRPSLPDDTEPPNWVTDCLSFPDRPPRPLLVLRKRSDRRLDDGVTLDQMLFGRQRKERDLPAALPRLLTAETIALAYVPAMKREDEVQDFDERDPSRSRHTRGARRTQPRGSTRRLRPLARPEAQLLSDHSRRCSTRWRCRARD